MIALATSDQHVLSAVQNAGLLLMEKRNGPPETLEHFLIGLPPGSEERREW